MKPTQFPQATHFIPAIAQEDGKTINSDLHYYKSPDGVVVSCWEPSQEEIDQIVKDKKIFVIIPMSSQPPMNLLTADPFLPGTSEPKNMPPAKKKAKILGMDGKPL